MNHVDNEHSKMDSKNAFLLSRTAERVARSADNSKCFMADPLQKWFVFLWYNIGIGITSKANGGGWWPIDSRK